MKNHLPWKSKLKMSCYFIAISVTTSSRKKNTQERKLSVERAGAGLGCEKMWNLAHFIHLLMGMNAKADSDHQNIHLTS